MDTGVLCTVVLGEEALFLFIPTLIYSFISLQPILIEGYNVFSPIFRARNLLASRVWYILFLHGVFYFSHVEKWSGIAPCVPLYLQNKACVLKEKNGL